MLFNLSKVTRIRWTQDSNLGCLTAGPIFDNYATLPNTVEKGRNVELVGNGRNNPK